MTWPGLAPEHLADLERSGLSAETIAALGIESVRPGDIAKLAQAELRGVASALKFPYPGGTFYRLKLFPPLTGGDGHTRKYHQPAGTVPDLYVPPTTGRAMQDPAARVLITEGEKKAAKADQEGFACLGIGGCWAWKQKDGDRMIDGFGRFAWKDRPVLLVPDADATQKPQVLDGFFALGKRLEALGAVCSLALMPVSTAHGPGLDDLLVARGVPALEKVLTDAKPLKSPRWREAARRYADRIIQREFVGQVQTLGAFLAKPLAIPADLIGPGVVPAHGLTALVGPAKVGKTWLAMLLGLSVSGASPCFFLPDLPVAAGGRVLYLNLEVAAHAFQARLKTLLAEMDAAGMPTGAALRAFLTVTLRGRLRLDQPEGMRQALALAGEYRPCLMVLDTLARTHHLDENDAGAMSRLAGALVELADRAACAVLFVHHAGKSDLGDRQEIHYGRGHSALGDAVDSQLNLRPQGSPGPGRKYRLTFTLRNGPEREPLLLSREAGTVLWRAEGEGDAVLRWMLRRVEEAGEIAAQDLDTEAVEAGLCSARRARSIRYESAFRAATETIKDGFRGKHLVRWKALQPDKTALSGWGKSEAEPINLTESDETTVRLPYSE